MDNETTRCNLPAKSIDRIVIYIVDIFQTMIEGDDPLLTIKKKDLKIEDLRLKIKEKVDISLIDQRVRNFTDDFAKLFNYKNNYPTLLLKINRILLIFGEEKIKKIYDLVKYIANVESTKLNDLHFYSKKSNSTKNNFEESKENEIGKHIHERELYSLKNSMGNFHCPKSISNPSVKSADSIGNSEKDRSSPMPNIRCIKDKKDENQVFFDDVINAKNQSINIKLVNIEKIQQDKREEREKIIFCKNGPPINLADLRELNLNNEREIKNDYINASGKDLNENQQKNLDIIVEGFFESNSENTQRKSINEEHNNTKSFSFSRDNSIDKCLKINTTQQMKQINNQDNRKSNDFENGIDLIGKKCYRKDSNCNLKVETPFNQIEQIPNFQETMVNILNKDYENVNNKYFINENNSLDLNEQNQIQELKNKNKRVIMYNNDFNFEYEMENSEDFFTFEYLSSGNESNKALVERNNFDKNQIKTEESKIVVSYVDRNNRNFELNNEINIYDKKPKQIKMNEYSHTHMGKDEKNIVNRKIEKNIRGFFEMKKTDNKTIKSIDDSTTVSTQFTKEKIDFLNKNSTITKSNCLKSICSDRSVKINSKNLNLGNDLEDKTNKILKDNPLLNKFLRQDNKIDKNLFSEIENLNENKIDKFPKNYIPKKVFLESLSEEENESKNKSSILPLLKELRGKELIGEGDYFDKNQITFSVKNDFNKTLNDNKGDSKSNEVFKNLLATAKYFNLDG